MSKVEAVQDRTNVKYSNGAANSYFAIRSQIKNAAIMLTNEKNRKLSRLKSNCRENCWIKKRCKRGKTWSTVSLRVNISGGSKVDILLNTLCSSSHNGLWRK